MFGPGVIIPAKFKFPDFEKYKGASDPRMHIRAYFWKMVAYSDDDRLLMHFFQDSLSGASLDWYMQLEGTHIQSWRDMVEAFLKNYQYNTDMALNHTQLQNLTQKHDETFKEYAQCLRDLAARVETQFLERELVEMLMVNLQESYWDIMVGRTSSCFFYLVFVDERIENMIKMRKIQNAASTSGLMKKPYMAYGKKREGETNATTVVRGRVSTYCSLYQQVAVVAQI